MNHRIVCYTLFDITQTGVVNRAKPSLDEDVNTWAYRRNTQANFDTILQAISLRSQPDVKKTPVKNYSNNSNSWFGDAYNNLTKPCPYWTFEFEVQHSSVFDDETELGALYSDCDGIPMLLCGTECPDMLNTLNVSKMYKNIHFVK